MDKCLYLGIERVHTSRHAVIMAPNLMRCFNHLPKITYTWQTTKLFWCIVDCLIGAILMCFH